MRFTVKTALSFALALLLAAISAPPVRADVTAHFIDVGQAEAILVEMKTAAILIDTGGEDTIPADRDSKHLLDYLDKFFANRQDLNKTLYSIIITHPHIDHTRLLIDVLGGGFKVLNFVEGGAANDGSDEFQPVVKARSFVHTHHILRNVVRDSQVGPSGYQTSHLKALETIYGMLDTEDVGPERQTSKAVYCTCWDGDVVVTLKPDGSTPEVTVSHQ
jgi:hypothetical protein